MKIIIGPPGTGKTTTLLDILDSELDRVDPDKIAFVSFTRKGAYEARDRAIDKFNFLPQDFAYFRTLHSIAYRYTVPNHILNKTHYRELGKLLGLRFTGYHDSEELPGTVDSGDRLLFLDGFARNTCQELHAVWHSHGEDLDWFWLKHVRSTFKEYKKIKGLVDFTDLIEEFIKRNRALPVEVAIVDEAQDLSTLQWQMVNVAFRYAKRIYIAGDDDQAIYKWSGADVKHFLNLDGQLQFLKKSHRLPKSIFKLSQKIAAKIRNRHSKTFTPRGKEGSVTFHNHLDSVQLDDSSWLLLARNRYMLKEYEEMARYHNCIYSTRQGSSVDAEHVEMIEAHIRLRKGKHVESEKKKRLSEYCRNNKIDLALPWYEALIRIPYLQRKYYQMIDINKEPNIHIDSIHGVKGGEADNVVLMTDMSFKTYQSYLKNEDDEHRVFYVGATRARKNLHIIMPQTEKGYLI